MIQALMKSLACLSALVFVTTSSLAAPLYEPFNFAAGATLIGQTASFDSVTWQQAGPNAGLTNQPMIVAGNLEYPGRPPSKGNSVLLGGNGCSARFSFQNVHTIRRGSLYYSFLMQVTDLTGISTDGVFWVGFNNTQGSQTAVVGSGGACLIIRGVVENGATNRFQIGISKNAGQIAAAGFSTNLFTANETILIVASYDYQPDGAEVSRVWINPDPATFGAGSDPPHDALAPNTGTALNNIRSFVLCNRNDAEPRRVIVDDLLIGTSWADVVPGTNDMQVSIAPIDQRVTPGTDALFEIRAIRADSYQWQFKGVGISGATGTRLVITNAHAADVGTYSVVMSNTAALATNSAALSVVSGAFPSLSNLWSLAPGSRSYITAGDHQRTLAYYAPSNHLYVLSRTNVSGTTVESAGLTINVLDATTGGHQYQLRTTDQGGAQVITGASGSTILSGIAVADDGALYACNVSDTSGGSAAQWKLYRWADGGSNTSPRLVFGPSTLALQSISLRWGDALAVRGSGTNTQVMVDDDEGLFVTMLTPTDETLNTFDYLFPGVVFQYASQSYGRGVTGRTLLFGPGDTIWQMRRGRPYGRPPALARSAYDFNSRTTTVETNLNVFTSLTGPLGMDSTHLAAIIFAPDSSTPDSLALFDISDTAAPILLSRQNFPVNRQNNANSFGQVIVAGNRVFALDANNGLMGFVIAPPGATPPSLNIARGGGDVLISWNTNAADYALEKTASLSPPNWSNAGSPAIVEGEYVVTNSASGNGFYRLKK